MSKTTDTRINDQIRVAEVRLIDAEGEQAGVVKTADALARAEEAGLDLVEISPNAAPPVCRIMDYGKFLYQKSKKQAEAKKNQKQIQVKEIKFRPGTEEGDYQVKLRKIREFLEEGDRVKVSLRFRGREMAHQELGLEMLQRVGKDVEDIGQVEQAPQAMGRQMIMQLTPKKK